MDTTGNHCADYSEFFAFCKLQVDSLLGRWKKGGELADRSEVDGFIALLLDKKDRVKGDKFHESQLFVLQIQFVSSKPMGI